MTKQTRNQVQIEARDLSRHFRVLNRKRGLGGALRNLFSRDYREVQAVQGINLRIRQGELVGYIGPNGAGKSTTIKMLTGILEKTSGTVQVLGRDPFRQRRHNAAEIGVVFGQRTSLWWDIPPIESFRLLKEIYTIPAERYQANLDFFIDLLEMDSFLDTPVRKLSLGQKMRSELVAALLHDPKILYLDEPTIGLDAVSKQAIRGFIKEVNRRHKTTVLLTTHDLDDIEELCKRILIIDQGSILYDGPLARFKEKWQLSKTLQLDLMQPIPIARMRALLPGGDCVSSVQRSGRLRYLIRFDARRTRGAELVTRILKQCQVHDFTIQEEDIESIIRRVYARSRNGLTRA